MIDDPYRSPETDLIEAPQVASVESATKVRRFFNWLMDTLVVYALIALAVVMAFLIGDDRVAVWIENMDRLTDYAISYAMAVVYYTIMEGVFGFSIGKLVTGTRVVDEYGKRLTFGRGFLRSVCRLIPFDAISLLLSDDDVRRAWHDSITRTYVVRRKGKAPADDGLLQGVASDSTAMSSS